MNRISKEEFVKNYLEPAFKVAGVNIKAMDYKAGGSGLELIKITYHNDYEEFINVSMDSHIAMIKDIIKQTEEF